MPFPPYNFPDNLKIAAGLQAGQYSGTEWSDGDCYKWIEAMAYMYAVTRDAFGNFVANVAADANAAWSGRAASSSGMPSSSRA